MISISNKEALQKLGYSGMLTMPLWERVGVDIRGRAVEVLHIPMGWIISQKGGEHPIFVRKNDKEMEQKVSKESSIKKYCVECHREVKEIMGVGREATIAFKCERGHINNIWCFSTENKNYLKGKDRVNK